MSTIIKFLLVGASGVAVNLGSFLLLLHAGLTRYLASPVAIEISIVSNFLLHNRWTFRWRRMEGTAQLRGLKFNAVSLAVLGISYSTFVLFSLLLPDVAPVVHQLLAIIPATLFNYVLNSQWTFRDAGSS